MWRVFLMCAGTCRLGVLHTHPANKLINCISSLIDIEHIINDYAWFSTCTRNSSLFITATALTTFPALQKLQTVYAVVLTLCACFFCFFLLSDLLHSSLHWLLSSTPMPDQQFLYFWNDLSAPSNGHACIHKDTVICHTALPPDCTRTWTDIHPCQ